MFDAIARRRARFARHRRLEVDARLTAWRFLMTTAVCFVNLSAAVTQAEAFAALGTVASDNPTRQVANNARIEFARVTCQARAKLPEPAPTRRAPRVPNLSL
ncbi:MAG: hypothetical protein WAO61_01795 [Solirubrobacterales bacterium]